MVAGTGALLTAIGGAAAGVAVLTRDGGDAPRIITAVGQPAQDAAPAGPGGHEPAPQLPTAQARPGDAGGTPHTPARPGRTAARDPHRAGTPQTADHSGPQTADHIGPQSVILPAPAHPTTPLRAAVPASAAPAKPAQTTRTDVEIREVPFRTRLVPDTSLPRGSKRVRTPGIPGVQTRRYLVTVTDGKVTGRRLIDAKVTRPPQHRVVAFGAQRVLDPKADRDCQAALTVCVPLGRSAICPADTKPADTKPAGTKPADTKPAGTKPAGTKPAGTKARPSHSEESMLALGGSVVVLDLELIDAENLGLGTGC